MFVQKMLNAIGFPLINGSHASNFSDHDSISELGDVKNQSEMENIEPWCMDLQSSDLIYSSDYHTSPLRQVVASVLLIFIIFTVIGNSIVIVVVLIDRRLRRITSGLIISMAAADILVGLLVELHGVTNMFLQRNASVSNFVCELAVSADVYFSFCELSHLVCLALERYLVICHPFVYERFGKKFLTSIIICAWTIPFIFSFLPILLLWHRVGQEELYDCLDSLNIDLCVFYPNKIFSSLLFVVMFILPTILLLYCYTRILRVALEHRKKIGTLTNLRVYYDSQDAIRDCSIHEENKRETPPRSQYSGDESDNNVIDFSKKNNCDQKTEEKPFLEINDKSNDKTIIPKVKPDKPSTDESSVNSTRLKTHKENFRLQALKSEMKETIVSKCDICRAVCGIDDFRASRSIIYVCICFLITWAPYMTLIFISPFVGPMNLPKESVMVALWLFSLGTAVNPFVYYFSNTKVRRGILRVFKKLMFKYTRCCDSEQSQN